MHIIYAVATNIQILIHIDTHTDVGVFICKSESIHNEQTNLMNVKIELYTYNKYCK